MTPSDLTLLASGIATPSELAHQRPIYSTTARVSGWGSDYRARRVSGLTPQERAAVRDGREVRIAGCPSYLGETDRVVIERGGRFYTRMPL